MRWIAFFVNTIKRRASNIDHSVSDKGLHIIIEKGQKQNLNVSTIGIGIGHDDDFAVVTIFYIEIRADSRTDCLNNRGKFRVCQHAFHGNGIGIERFST